MSDRLDRREVFDRVGVHLAKQLIRGQGRNHRTIGHRVGWRRLGGVVAAQTDQQQHSEDGSGEPP